MSNRTRPTPIAQELLSAYIDEQVTAGERRQVETFLASAPAASRQLADLRYVRELLAELPPEPVPRPLTLSEAQAGPARVRPDWLAWLKPLYLRGAAALVAMCLLVLTIGDISFRTQLLPVSQPVAVTQAEVDNQAANEGDPVTIIGKTSTSEAAAQQTEPGSPGFLSLAPGLLLSLEVVLGALLLLLLVASWQLRRFT